MLLLAGGGQAFARSPKLANVLPSEVKRVVPQKNTAPAKPKTSKNQKLAQKKNKPPPEPLAPAMEALDPSTSKYQTRTVFFWKSASPLPANFRCDDDIQDKKKFEAEQLALGKCEANGVEDCSVQEVKIVKNGKLVCADIPGGVCQRGFHYAGCVALAVVLGEKNETENLSAVFE